MNFSARVIAAREHAKLTQEALAKAVGVSQQSVTKWETKSKASRHTTKIASVCGVRPEWLADGIPPMLLEKAATQPPSQLLELDADILASSIVSLKESAERSEVVLDFFHAAEALAYVYGQRVKHPKKMTKAEYVVFDEEIRKKLSKGSGNEEVGRRETLGGTEGISEPAAKTKKARASGSGGQR